MSLAILHRGTVTEVRERVCVRESERGRERRKGEDGKGEERRGEKRG